VSAPCTWEEIDKGTIHPRSFTVRNMADRIGDVGDLWAEMLKKKRSLTRAIAKVRALRDSR
jgi:bifunctional non-homologous end joining protein LigD